MFIAFRIAILAGFLALTMAGCSEMTRKPVAEAPPKPRPQLVSEPAVAKATTAAEPGAIWSETSRWNDMYSVSAGRGTGDLILVKPTDSFRVSVANRGGKGAGNVTETSSSRENTFLVVAIKDVLPHNIYSVATHQMLKVGTREHEVTLNGKIREQDIAPDDTISSEMIFDLNLEVSADPEPPKVAAVGAEGADAKTKKDEKGEN